MPRIEYAGAIYHIMCRGDRQEAIFYDDVDREMFLETLGETCERAGFVIYSYVLMDNHYHLLLETPEANLVAGMTWFQSTYTARFNARHRQRGHVFQGRYKAIGVDEDEPEYARVASDYIHLNPARAGIVNVSRPKLKDYRWSSYPGICQGGKLPKWLKAETLMNWHGLSLRQRKERSEYERYLQSRAAQCWESKRAAQKEEQAWLKALRRGWYLGGEDFRYKLEKLAAMVVKKHRRDSYSGQSLRTHDLNEAQRLLKSGLHKLKLDLDAVQRMKKNDERKQGLAWLIKSHSVVGDQWLQENLEMGHRSNISRAMQVYRKESNIKVRKWKNILHICTD